MSDPHVLELLPAYVLGSLDETERLLVSEHQSGCPACTAELLAYQTVADQLALTAPAAIPSPDLKRRLMARLQAPPATPSSQIRPSWGQRLGLKFSPRLVGLAGFLLIAVLAVSNLLLWQRVTQLETALRSSGMRAIPLLSTGLIPGAAGFVIIGADGQNGAFVVDALPTLAEDQQYQLWLIQNEQRSSGAIFSVDENGYGGGRIRAPLNLFDYSGCDVSVEPAGGSSWPTGDKVLVGDLD